MAVIEKILEPNLEVNIWTRVEIVEIEDLPNETRSSYPLFSGTVVDIDAINADIQLATPMLNIPGPQGVNPPHPSQTSSYKRRTEEEKGEKTGGHGASKKAKPSVDERP